MPAIRPRHAVIAAALLAVALAAGWAYKAQQERRLTATITALAKESGTRLREALDMDARPPDAQGARRFAEHHAAVDAHLQKLRGLDTASRLALAEAADDYVLTTREILRRLATAHRARLEFAQSTRALLEHMRADHGAAAWVSEAVRLKDRVEQDYAEHKAAADALAGLFEAFPAAQDHMAPYLESALLIDGRLLQAARERAAASAQQATAEIEKIRKWVPRGPGRLHG